MNVNYSATAYPMFDFEKVTCLDKFILSSKNCNTNTYSHVAALKIK